MSQKSWKKLINLTKLGQITNLNMNFYNGGVSLSISLNLNSPQFPAQLRNGQLERFKGLFTWSEVPRTSGVGFFCFHALGDTKQKKLTPLDRSPPLHANRV